jgi:hypothetical protein
MAEEGNKKAKSRSIVKSMRNLAGEKRDHCIC